MAARMQKGTETELTERVVSIKRVSKVVKGGKRFKFSVLVVAGDGNGQVGMGMGKAREIPEAVRKGIEKAKKSMVTLKKVGNTVAHPIIGHFGAAEVLLKPAAPGTGVIAGCGGPGDHGTRWGEGCPNEGHREDFEPDQCGLRDLRSPAEHAYAGRDSSPARQGPQAGPGCIGGGVMAMLKIKWKRSCIGRPDKQERTIRAFGFRKLNDTVEMEDTPQIRGMIAAVHHLVDWEVIEK